MSLPGRSCFSLSLPASTLTSFHLFHTRSLWFHSYISLHLAYANTLSLPLHTWLSNTHSPSLCSLRSLSPLRALSVRCAFSVLHTFFVLSTFSILFALSFLYAFPDVCSLRAFYSPRSLAFTFPPAHLYISILSLSLSLLFLPSTHGQEQLRTASSSGLRASEVSERIAAVEAAHREELAQVEGDLRAMVARLESEARKLRSSLAATERERDDALTAAAAAAAASASANQRPVSRERLAPPGSSSRPGSRPSSQQGSRPSSQQGRRSPSLPESLGRSVAELSREELEEELAWAHACLGRSRELHPAAPPTPRNHTRGAGTPFLRTEKRPLYRKTAENMQRVRSYLEDELNCEPDASHWRQLVVFYYHCEELETRTAELKRAIEAAQADTSAVAAARAAAEAETQAALRAAEAEAETKLKAAQREYESENRALRDQLQRLGVE